jgi:hypothetical protein
MSIRKLAN